MFAQVINTCETKESISTAKEAVEIMKKMNFEITENVYSRIFNIYYY